MESATPNLAETLARFNRKERFWLLREAAGANLERLSPDFLRAIQGELRKSRPDIVVPETAWWAMDYHYDWIYGAIALHAQPDAIGDTFDNPKKRITGNQQDCDLLIAFDDVIVLIEAKGVGAWTNGQIRPKLERLADLSAFSVSVGPPIELFLILMSPREPQKLETENWPSWTLAAGKPLWLELRAQGSFKDYLMVSRCDKGRNVGKGGGHWCIVGSLPRTALALRSAGEDHAGRGR